MPSRLLDWSQHLLTRLPALLPSSCALCGVTHDAAICSACHRQSFGQTRHRCLQCAIPLIDHAATTCGACLDRPPAFDATIVATDYAAPMDQLVLALKFGGRLALASVFADALRDALLHSPAKEHGLPSLLTAVPLGPMRLKERGFNQALEIAKPLSRSLGLTLAPRLIVRQRDTHAQSLLHPDERHRNIRHAFMVGPDVVDLLPGKHVGVVDDVVTTGETLNELAATLKRFGAARVTNFVFARTLQK